MVAFMYCKQGFRSCRTGAAIHNVVKQWRVAAGNHPVDGMVAKKAGQQAGFVLRSKWKQAAKQHANFFQYCRMFKRIELVGVLLLQVKCVRHGMKV